MQTLDGGESKNSVRGDMPLERIPTEDGAILYDPSRLDHPVAADFDPAQLAAAGRLVPVTAGRGSAWFVAPPRPSLAPCVLRHYRRGGLIARLVRDRYVWRGAEATRPFRELRLLALLEARALPAPQPVAARYVRGAVGYRADLLTLAIPGTRSLARLAVDGLDLAQWMQVGATVRAFHDAGVRHADLNAHNVLIDERSRVHLIDFDRGVRVPPGRWCQHNLARLRRSLVKLRVLPPSGATPEWNALLAGYEAPLSAPPR